MGMAQVFDRSTTYSWYQGGSYEPCVVQAFEDLCRAGDVVFDVGANIGKLSIWFSRLVGPRGIVCAFEASPRIVEFTQNNIAASGCGNVQVFNFAVYHESFASIPIYNTGELNDSILDRAKKNAKGSATVNSVALDDFVESTGLTPNLIKFDIEGAEYEAILGLRQGLRQFRPIMVLEQQPKDDRCLNVLRDAGYRAIDLNNYREVLSPDDYAQGLRTRNVLFVPEEKLASTPYRLPALVPEPQSLTTAFAEPFRGNASIRAVDLHLEVGRYVARFDLIAGEPEDLIAIGALQGRRSLARFAGTISAILRTCPDFSFDVERPGQVRLYVKNRAGEHPLTLRVTRAELGRVENFDRTKMSPSSRFLRGV